MIEQRKKAAEGAAIRLTARLVLGELVYRSELLDAGLYTKDSLRKAVKEGRLIEERVRVRAVKKGEHPFDTRMNELAGFASYTERVAYRANMQLLKGLESTIGDDSNATPRNEGAEDATSASDAKDIQGTRKLPGTA